MILSEISMVTRVAWISNRVAADPESIAVLGSAKTASPAGVGSRERSLAVYCQTPGPGSAGG